MTVGRWHVINALFVPWLQHLHQRLTHSVSKLLVAILHLSVATFVAAFLVSITAIVSRSISQFSIYIRATKNDC